MAFYGDQSNLDCYYYLFSSGILLLKQKKSRERWHRVMWCVSLFADWHSFCLVRSHWIYQIPSESNWGDVSYSSLSFLLTTMKEWWHTAKVPILLQNLWSSQYSFDLYYWSSKISWNYSYIEYIMYYKPSKTYDIIFKKYMAIIIWR